FRNPSYLASSRNVEFAFSATEEKANPQGLARLGPQASQEMSRCETYQTGQLAPIPFRRAVEALFEPGPAFDVVVLARFRIRGEAREMLGETRLEHEGHRILQLHRLELGLRRLLEAEGVWPVRQHHVVERHAPWHEALFLGVILAPDEAHELSHDAAVVPGRADRALGDHPARGANDAADIGTALRAPP